MQPSSDTTRCIACSQPASLLVPGSFGQSDAQLPMCEECAPYLPLVFAEPSLGPALMRFHGVTDFEGISGSGVFSSSFSVSAAPADYEARANDFEQFCAFIGQQVRSLRSSDANDA